METFSFTITGGQFWGNDVVVAGTDVTRKQPTCQVKIVNFSRISEHSHDNNQGTQDRLLGEASLRGTCSAMELCGMSSKNYVALALNNANNASVSLLEIRDDYSTVAVPSFEQKADDHMLFNSLSYLSTHAHLASATESGDVVIADLETAVDIAQRSVDSAGTRSVRYTKSGMLAILGQSNAGQFLLWDRRAPPTGSGVEVACYQRPLVNNSRGQGVIDRDSYLTCLETHPSNEFEFYCGTSTGTIILWDIRKSDSSADGVVVELERSQHHSNGQAVTALAFKDESRSPYLLSGAADGSVACVNYHEKLHSSSTIFRQHGASQAGLGSNVGEIDLGFDQGTSTVMSIQSHPATQEILVTSKFGEVKLL